MEAKVLLFWPQEASYVNLSSHGPVSFPWVQPLAFSSGLQAEQVFGPPFILKMASSSP